MPNSTRGFASMDKDRQREIASKGGSSVRPEQRSFSQNRELAVEAGRKGGLSVLREQRAFFLNPELASRAGRRGGHASHGPHKKIAAE
jgi:general stress protein YciG